MLCKKLIEIRKYDRKKDALLIAGKKGECYGIIEFAKELGIELDTTKGDAILCDLYNL